MEEGIYAWFGRHRIELLDKDNKPFSCEDPKAAVAKILATPKSGALAFSTYNGSEALYKDWARQARGRVFETRRHRLLRSARERDPPPWFVSRLRVSSLRFSLKLTLNFNMQARRSYGGGHFGHRSLAGSFKDHINKTYGYKGMFLDMAWFAYGDRLSKKTLKQLVDAKFFQTDHILSTLCDDPENFFLMPAPLNVRFNIQSYQDFKRTFCGPGWAAAVFFVDKAIALQRQYGNY